MLVKCAFKGWYIWDAPDLDCAVRIVPGIGEVIKGDCEITDVYLQDAPDDYPPSA